MEAGEAFSQDVSQPQARRPTQHNGYRHPRQGRRGKAASLSHAGKGGKEDDDEHIVHRGPGENHLGDALVCAIALLHQPEHPGNDDRGGHRPHHCAHNGGVQHVHPQQPGSQQHHAQHLKGSGHEAQQHGGPPGPAQILQLQGQARPGEDDHQGELPQVCGNT